MSDRRPSVAWWVPLLWLVLAALWINSYGMRTQVEQQRVQVEEKRLELNQATEQRELCDLALTAYRTRHTYPFSDPGYVAWKMPLDCTGVLR